MRLRTTVGAYAGEIRDYLFSAGQAALKTGTAERVDQPVARAQAAVATPVIARASAPVATSRRRRHR
jgi:hypothetical protein